MTHPRRSSWRRACLGALATIVACTSVAQSKDPATAVPAARGPAAPSSLPDISGPGHVLTAGSLRMKVTNNGILGNPFKSISSDPSAQWPGASGVEYLNFIQLAVAAVNPFAPPGSGHHVSYGREWAPASLDPVDRIYTTAPGAPGGARFVNDDGDIGSDGFARFDEDFLDGRDNDGDGQVDEDFGALGTQMFTCMMRDDGPLSTTSNEPHVPIGLECRLAAWAYSGLRDFNPIELTIINRSGHRLDSVYVGFSVDIDAGPLTVPNYFVDDRRLGGYPSGEFTRLLVSGDPQRQYPHSPVPDASVDSALCPSTKVRINGFSVCDNDGDNGFTSGVASFLLLDHTIDPITVNGPSRVGFRAFRVFPSGTPWSAGGSPTNDSLRWVFMTSHEGVDPVSGFITVPASTANADYLAWCALGPFLTLPAGASLSVTIAFAVETGSYTQAATFPSDHAAYQAGLISGGALLAAHPPLANAIAAQVLHDGTYAPQPGAPVTDYHGRETAVIAPPGQVIALQDCRDAAVRFVGDDSYSWFDFDCDYCTGVWDFPSQSGLAHQTWTSTSPLVSVPRTLPSHPIALTMSPNPAYGLARVRFSLAGPERLDVAVFDMAGRRIRGLHSGTLGAGEHELAWDGEDQAGHDVAAGVYVLRVLAGDRTSTLRFVRVR